MLYAQQRQGRGKQPIPLVREVFALHLSLSSGQLGAKSQILRFPFLQLPLPSQGSVLCRREFGFEGFWPHTALGTALFADGAGDGGNFRSDSRK